jgi:SAM-dependent MidA family methyltransferase
VPSDFPQIEGNPKLIQKIVSEISRTGPLSFARFMEMALYDVPYGYYMTQAVEQEQSSRGSRERIGWSGDFFTAPELSPILAKTLVRQVLDIDVQLGHPNPFSFLELGGGNGTFARDFLQQVQAVAPDFMNRLSYHLVDRSPHLQSRQTMTMKKALGTWVDDHVKWWPAIEQVDSHSLTGVIFSNEMVDALPVHRVRLTGQQLQEIFVGYEGGQFVEHLSAVSSSRLADYIQSYEISLEEGQTAELPLEAEVWMTHVAAILQRGVVITIDYGHTARDYYRSDRKDGTLLCYYRHSISANPYIRVGEQDMTAHVNFSSLVRCGKTRGLAPVGFTALTNWLVGLDVEELVKDHNQESEDVQALMHLLHPQGMGKTFKVLVQQKGMENVSLQGLRC